MTTISTAAQSYAPPISSSQSGKSRMAEAIARQEQSGALSSTDATALTSALDSIDAGLSDSTSSTSNSSGGNRLDPSQMKDRIDSLISDQVSSGTLTSDQASELKNLFSSHGTSVTSATDSTGGPPPGPPPSGFGAGGGDGSSSSTAGVGSTSGTQSSSDLLATFIQQLQAAQSNSSAYGASGAAGTSQSSALLFDFRS